MSEDFDFGGSDSDSEAWGHVGAFLIENADWLPAPLLLGGACSFMHHYEAAPQPILHGVQDVAAYYAGIVVVATGQALMKSKRNRIATIVAGTALCALSYFSDNYLGNMFGSDKPEKAPTEQRALAPTPR